MSMNFRRKLPVPKEIKELYPLNDKIKNIKTERDAMIADVFTGKSDKFLLIIGPCSADNEDSVMDYTCRLSRLQEQVKDKIIIIPRIYTNKPRTTGEGYKGMIHQPDPTKGEDMLEGLIHVRKHAPLRRPALCALMKCCIPRTTATFPIYSAMSQ